MDRRVAHHGRVIDSGPDWCLLEAWGRDVDELAWHLLWIALDLDTTVEPLSAPVAAASARLQGRVAASLGG